MSKKLVYTIILQPESDPNFKGYYNASVPALSGCFSYGENRAQALTNIREAIELYLEDLQEEGEPIPEDHKVIAPGTLLRMSCEVGLSREEFEQKL